MSHVFFAKSKYVIRHQSISSKVKPLVIVDWLVCYIFVVVCYICVDCYICLQVDIPIPTKAGPKPAIPLPALSPTPVDESIASTYSSRHVSSIFTLQSNLLSTTFVSLLLSHSKVFKVCELCLYFV